MEILAAVIMFAFVAFIFVLVVSRLGGIEVKLAEHERMLAKQLEINDDLQAQIIAHHDATNERIAGLSEQINIDKWRD